MDRGSWKRSTRYRARRAFRHWEPPYRFATKACRKSCSPHRRFRLNRGAATEQVIALCHSKTFQECIPERSARYLKPKCRSNMEDLKEIHFPGTQADYQGIA